MAPPRRFDPIPPDSNDRTLLLMLVERMQHLDSCIDDLKALLREHQREHAAMGVQTHQADATTLQRVATLEEAKRNTDRAMAGLTRVVYGGGGASAALIIALLAMALGIKPL